MRRHKLIALLGLAVTVIAMLTAARTPQAKNSSSVPLLQQEKENKRNSQRRGKLIPIGVAPEESDPRKRALREDKNRRYNYERGESLILQGEAETYGRIEEVPPPPPLPISVSDVIVVGTITRAQPYLSETKRSIYSEYTVRVEEVIKGSAKLSLSPNDYVIADREGGALRLPDGRVLRYVAVGAGALPESGKRYTLFLQAIHDEQDFSIITGYELNEGSVFPLEDASDSSEYTGTRETDFLVMLRDAVTRVTRSQRIPGAG